MLWKYHIIAINNRRLQCKYSFKNVKVSYAEYGDAITYPYNIL